MAGTIKRIAGPLALSATLTTNVYNNTSALIYDVIRQINVCNKTATAATFTLYLGATATNAAGTELFLAVVIPPNTTVPFPMALRMNSTDFLVGGSGTAAALTITIMGEQYVV